jgi:hypothetical protein
MSSYVNDGHSLAEDLLPCVGKSEQFFDCGTRPVISLLDKLNIF